MQKKKMVHFKAFFKSIAAWLYIRFLKIFLKMALFLTKVMHVHFKSIDTELYKAEINIVSKNHP